MLCRGGFRTAATSKMERFVIIVNGWKPLTIITKCSILDVAAALDPHLAVHNELYLGNIKLWSQICRFIFKRILHKHNVNHDSSVIIFYCEINHKKCRPRLNLQNLHFFASILEELFQSLPLSWWRSLSYRNKSTDLLCISMDWFLYHRYLRH